MLFLSRTVAKTMGRVLYGNALSHFFSQKCMCSSCVRRQGLLQKPLTPLTGFRLRTAHALSHFSFLPKMHARAAVRTGLAKTSHSSYRFFGCAPPMCDGTQPCAFTLFFSSKNACPGSCAHRSLAKTSHSTYRFSSNPVRAAPALFSFPQRFGILPKDKTSHSTYRFSSNPVRAAPVLFSFPLLPKDNTSHSTCRFFLQSWLRVAPELFSFPPNVLSQRFGFLPKDKTSHSTYRFFSPIQRTALFGTAIHFLTLSTTVLHFHLFCLHNFFTDLSIKLLWILVK